MPYQVQHAQLLAILTGHNVRYHPTKKETLTTLQQLEPTLPHALTTMNKLHKNAISSAGNIIRSRIRVCQPGLYVLPRHNTKTDGGTPYL
jgi:hypothetical protein